MWKLNARLIRTIPKIVMEYIWEAPPIEILVIKDFTIPKEIIPDIIINISWLFE